MAAIHLNKRVAHSLDDGYARANDDGSSSSAFNTTTRTLSVIRSNSSGGFSFWAYVRFTNITIPQGQTFYQSRLGLSTSRLGSYRTEGKSYRIYGIDTDNFSRPTANNDIVGASLTTAYNDFTIGGRNAGYHLSVKSIIEEIVSRPGWSSGNAIGFVIKPNFHAIGYYSKSFHSYDNNYGLFHRPSFSAFYDPTAPVKVTASASGSTTASVGTVIDPDVTPEKAEASTTASIGASLVHGVAYPIPDPATATTSNSVTVSDSWDAFKPASAEATVSTSYVLRGATIVNFVRMRSTYTGLMLYEDQYGKIFYCTGINETAPSAPAEGVVTNLYHLKDVQRGRLIFQDGDGSIRYSEGY